MIDQILLKRAIIYPSAEIYGGIAGFFEYGSIGKRIKRKFEDYWRKYFLSEPNFHEIEGSSILPEKVFIASGHVKEFVDPVVECKKCGLVERADQILEAQLKRTFEGLSEKELQEVIKKNNIRCPNCGGELRVVGQINLMFPVNVGPYKNISAYLRPETAQCAYLDFLREYNANRKKLPLGLAIIGRAFRNEISPRQGIFRAREFTQAELQIFFNPNKPGDYPLEGKVNIVLADEREKGVQNMELKELGERYFPMYAHYLKKVYDFYQTLFGSEKVRLYEKSEVERAFYNKFHVDVEVYFPQFKSYKEVAGIHYRTDHDLKRHEKLSGKSFVVGEEKCIPHVLELSFGVDRTILALLYNGYREEGKRRWIALPKIVAPYLAGVYPLVSKDGLPEKAREIYEFLIKEGIDVFYDEKGSIGKRYARADEIGVYYGITIDYQTLEDNTVTVRDRDTTAQERVSVEELPAYLKQ